MKTNFAIHIVAAWLLLAAITLVKSPAVFAASSDNNAGPVEITIDNFSFTPPSITVKAGTPITWTNRDDIPHTVVSSDFVFKSKALDTDDKFSFTLTKPGTYTYFCSLHPKMTAKVVVQ
jgi:plastocyanin